MRKIALAWTLFLAAAAIARAQDVEAHRVPFELKNQIILVKGSLCGEDGHVFVLDSGASETVITPAAAKKAGLKGGLMVMCPSVAAGDAKAENLRVVVMDPPQAQPLRQMGVDYSGILGQSFFAEFVSTIDYQKQEIVFVPADRAPKTEKDERSLIVDFRLVNNIIIVEGTINGQGPQTLIFDTGASETVITPDTAKALGLKTVPRQTQMGRLEKATVEKIQLGDAVAKDIDVIVWDPPQAQALHMLGVDYNGFLGYSFMSQFVITLDYRQSRIKLTPVGAKRVTVATSVVLGLKLRPSAEVEDIEKGSLASKAGFKKGDLVNKVNGISIASAEEFGKIWSIAKSGDRLEVTVTREKKPVVLKLTK